MGAHELTANQKYCHSEVSSSLILCNNKPFLNWIWCVMKSAFYTTTSDDQLSGWTEIKLQNTSQSQTCTKKRSWSLSGNLLLVWSPTAFWIPVKPLYLRSMFSKSMRCSENRNTCRWQWSAKRTQFFSMTMPDSTLNQCFKLEWIGLWSFASSAIFTCPLANWLPFL